MAFRSSPIWHAPRVQLTLFDTLLRFANRSHVASQIQKRASGHTKVEACIRQCPVSGSKSPCSHAIHSTDFSCTPSQMTSSNPGSLSRVSYAWFTVLYALYVFAHILYIPTFQRLGIRKIWREIWLIWDGSRTRSLCCWATILCWRHWCFLWSYCENGRHSAVTRGTRNFTIHSLWTFLVPDTFSLFRTDWRVNLVETHVRVGFFPSHRNFNVSLYHFTDTLLPLWIHSGSRSCLWMFRWQHSVWCEAESACCSALVLQSGWCWMRFTATRNCC